MHQLTTAAVVGTDSHKKLLTWVMFLVQMVLMGRPSEVCCYCPLIEDIIMPPDDQWDADGYPAFFDLGLRMWKQRGIDHQGKRCCCELL